MSRAKSHGSGSDPGADDSSPEAAERLAPLEPSSLLGALEIAGREVRWRLLLGGESSDTPAADRAAPHLTAPGLPRGPLEDADAALSALDPSSEGPKGRAGNLAGSRPRLLRWLKQVDALFPPEVARVLRTEAVKRQRLEQLLLEPALLTPLEPDASLLAQLIDLAQRLPETARAAARQRIAEQVEALTAQLDQELHSAVGMALRRASRGPLRRTRSLDLRRTVRDNLRHWDPTHQRLGISRLRFHGAGTHGLPFRLILALDSSGSMAASQVHGAITASVLSQVPALETRVVLFDAALVELPQGPIDAVELLLSTRLGGGTDLAGALGHCARLVEDPARTLLILLSDLHEGGRPDAFLGQLASLQARGVRCLCLLALDDAGGAEASHTDNAEAVRSLGIPTLAISPGRLPELLAQAIRGATAQELATDG